MAVAETTESTNESLPCVHRDYELINEIKDRSEYDLDLFEIQTAPVDQYTLWQRVGRGKYSEVFEGTLNTRADDSVCIKILKPCPPNLLKLEIKILQMLRDGPNIVKLHDVLQDSDTKLYCLVTDYIQGHDFKNVYKTITPMQVAFYFHQLLRGLDFIHSNGIMHRDIKPQNVLVDVEHRRLRIIDFGLGDFYFPNKQYPHRVATRAWKAPELLSAHRKYNYAVDLWSVGIMVADIIFGQEHTFNGSTNEEQLVRIIEHLGMNDYEEYLEKYNVKKPPQVSEREEEFRRDRTTWEGFVEKRDETYFSDSLLDFIDKILRYDPDERLTAREAMAHACFEGVVERTDEVVVEDGVDGGGVEDDG